MTAIEDDIAKVYDGFAATYAANRFLFDISEILESFYRVLGMRDGHLLDLGCGAGEPVARSFLDRGWDVTGVDISARMLELAATYAPGMRRVCGDMTGIDLKPASFDAVAATYSVFHVPGEKHERLFRNIHGWLRPGGKALFTYATRAYTGRETFRGFKEFMGQQLFYSHLAPEALHGMLTHIGFDVITADSREIGGETFLWVTIGKR